MIVLYPQSKTQNMGMCAVPLLILNVEPNGINYMRL